jgi:hypothetical protein
MNRPKGNKVVSISGGCMIVLNTVLRLFSLLALRGAMLMI